MAELACIAGHYPQELVISVVMSTDNTVLVTGDSSGIIKTWAVSGFSSVGPSPSAAVASKEMWRGHEKGVASLEWVAQDESRLFLSAGYDMRVCVWRDDGCHVGTFGEVRLLCFFVSGLTPGAEGLHERTCRRTDMIVF